MNFYYLRIDGFVKSGLADRKDWGSGPWDGEPDYKYWMSHGLDCVIARNPFGSWCGYVGVGSDHPCYNEHCEDVAGRGIQTHGGITYADISRDDTARPIPIAGKVVWWIGFDCNHMRDSSPGLPSVTDLTQMPGKSYKTIQYIVGQTNDLAKQLRALHP